jgi:hypothetical protein
LVSDLYPENISMIAGHIRGGRNLLFPQAKIQKKRFRDNR